MAILTEIARGDVGGRFPRGSAAVVAAETGTEDGGVLDAYHRAPRGCRVTVLAGGGGGDMGARLAGSSAAVVAGGAIVRDAGVIKARTCPTDRRVTVGTQAARWRMGRCFPRGHRAVVAGGAVGRGLGVVEVYGTPGRGRVTGRAVIRGRRMTRRFHRRLGDTAGCMAGFADLRRAFEYPSHMAALTGNYRVLSLQWKSSAQMIEV